MVSGCVGRCAEGQSGPQASRRSRTAGRGLDGSSAMGHRRVGPRRRRRRPAACTATWGSRRPQESPPSCSRRAVQTESSGEGECGADHDSPRAVPPVIVTSGSRVCPGPRFSTAGPFFASGRRRGSRPAPATYAIPPDGQLFHPPPPSASSRRECSAGYGYATTAGTNHPTYNCLYVWIQCIFLCRGGAGVGAPAPVAALQQPLWALD